MTSLLAWILALTPAFAQDDGSFVNYESIVSELKLDADTAPPKPRHEEMNWDAIAIHGSLGLAGALITVPNQRRGTGSSGLLKGFEVGAGANLFTRDARAELAFRNYANERLARGLDAEMREFEARMIFLPKLRDDVRVRMGLGLTQRLLSVAGDAAAGNQSGAYYALVLGGERSIGNALSIGPDLAYRDSLTHARGRKSSWDASFRLNATF